MGDLGLIPGLGQSPGEGKGYPVQYSGLENSMDSIVHGVAESDMTETFTFIYISSELGTSIPKCELLMKLWFSPLQ